MPCDGELLEQISRGRQGRLGGATRLQAAWHAWPDMMKLDGVTTVEEAIFMQVKASHAATIWIDDRASHARARRRPCKLSCVCLAFVPLHVLAL